MPSVFLSHASEDKALAEPIQLALATAGYNVFYDELSLPPGGDYHHRIETAVKRCDVFVFIASPASITEGKYTLLELKYARARWPSPINRVLPVVTDGLKPADLPPYLQPATILSINRTGGAAAAEVRTAVAAIMRGIVSKRRATTTAIVSIGLALTTAFYLLYPFGGSKSSPSTSTPNRDGKIIVADPEFIDSSDSRGYVPGVLLIPKGMSRPVNLTLKDRSVHPECEQTRNTFPDTGKKYHNLDCKIERQNEDGTWTMTIKMSKDTGGLYYFRLSAGEVSRIGTVFVP